MIQHYILYREFRGSLSIALKASSVIQNDLHSISETSSSPPDIETLDEYFPVTIDEEKTVQTRDVQNHSDDKIGEESV